MDLLFLIGLLIKTLEYLIADKLFDISDLKMEDHGQNDYFPADE